VCHPSSRPFSRLISPSLAEATLSAWTSPVTLGGPTREYSCSLIPSAEVISVVPRLERLLGGPYPTLARQLSCRASHLGRWAGVLRAIAEQGCYEPYDPRSETILSGDPHEVRGERTPRACAFHALPKPDACGGRAGRWRGVISRRCDARPRSGAAPRVALLALSRAPGGLPFRDACRVVS
jgi:hypothetical protein